MDPVFRFIFVCLFVVYKRLQKYGKGLVGLGFQYMYVLLVHSICY